MKNSLTLSLFLSWIAVSPAVAQAPRILNTLPLPSADAAELLVPEALFGERSGGTPDTTAPWRYYPLAIGNAWEYYRYGTGTVYRHEITRDTLIHERRYTVVDRYTAEDNGPLEPDYSWRYRFDTLSSLVYEPNGSGGERVPFGSPCPFNTDFDTTTECPGFSGVDFTVLGSYDGLVVFGEPFPGQGEDTVRTAFKVFRFETLEWRYAAGFGEVYHESDIQAYGLYYARIDGVEYGQPRFPVANESTEPDPIGQLALSVWPNPARGRANVSFELSRAGTVVLEVYDVLGRRMQYDELGLLPAGSRETQVDLAGFAAGSYVVQVRAGRDYTARLLTLIE